MYNLPSYVLLAFLPFASGEKCANQGGLCDQLCPSGTVAATVNDCAGTQYCCVRKTPVGPKVDAAPAGGKTPPVTEKPGGAGAVAPGEGSARKEHFGDNILVCSPLKNKYVGSNREPLACNSDQTTLELLYKDGYRLIQIVEDGKKAIYYLDKK